MTRWRPDPTFYPSPKEAIEAPDERLAYVALLNPKGSGESDGIGVVDLNPDSKSYGNVLHKTEFPNADNELHHFG
jgi:selenium-binding protein 1